MRVDFKIDTKIGQVIIEYNGIQHYEPVPFNGDKELAKANFARQIKRDQWLRDYCNLNNIILIEIDGRKYTKDKIEPYLVEQLTYLGLLPPAVPTNL